MNRFVGRALYEAKNPLVAILGISMRLPGGISSLEKLWSFLADGGDAIADLPEDRWLVDLYDPTGSRPGHTYVRRGGYIDGLDQIDAQFFGMSAREASRVDPQHRLLLETAFEALDASGLPLAAISQKRVGVFVGLSSNDYSICRRATRAAQMPIPIPAAP